MLIGDLPRPILTVKGHFNPEFPDRVTPRNGWVGFTPTRDEPASREQLRATVSRQMGNGYVLEYVTLSRPPPNAAARPITPEEKDLHARAAGSLTAVFKLARRHVHARDLVDPQQYKDMQDRWDQRGDRARWSVAFPIIEAWEINGWPKARNVLGMEAAGRTCELQSQSLKPLEADDQAKLAPLEIAPINLPADGLAARYFVALAQQENRENSRPADSLSPQDRPLLEDYSAVEGMTKEQRIRVVLRDRQLVKALKRIGPLRCSNCTYDPIQRGASQAQARAILEAHHVLPVSAGERLSRLSDLVLLCPTCHREVHQGLFKIPAPNLVAGVIQTNLVSGSVPFAA
jgi:5-methylcytosine-specific restriction protein A